MRRRKRPERFSVTKAVKSNARDRVGTPPPSHALPDEKTKAARRAAKHRVTMEKLLEGGAEPCSCQHVVLRRVLLFLRGFVQEFYVGKVDGTGCGKLVGDEMLPGDYVGRDLLCDGPIKMVAPDVGKGHTHDWLQHVYPGRRKTDLQHST